jgi:hypothetical protein
MSNIFDLAAKVLGTTNTEAELNALVAKHSAFKDMDDFLAQRKHGYRPTLDVADFEIKRIADAYDACMAALGCPLRAYRYENTKTVAKNKRALAAFNRKTIQVKEG